MRIDIAQSVRVKNPVEDEHLEHPEDRKTQHVHPAHERGIREVTPVVGVHEVLGVGGTQERERDAEERHSPVGDHLISKMALAAFAPRPRSIQVIRGNDRDDVAKECRFDDARDDLESVGDENRRE